MKNKILTYMTLWKKNLFMIYMNFEETRRERDREQKGEKRKTSFLKHKNNIYMNENAVLQLRMNILSPFFVMSL